MSRNPILSDAAFGGTTTTAERPSPADEWRNAQAGAARHRHRCGARCRHRTARPLGPDRHRPAGP